MESQKIKENRRAKFLAKMEKNKASSKKETTKIKKSKEDLKQIPTNDNSSINSPKNIQTSQPENSSSNKDKNKDNNVITTNFDNNIDLNAIMHNINSINNLLNQNIQKENNEKNVTENIIKDNTINNTTNDKNTKNINNDLNKTQIPKESKIDYIEIIQNIEKYDNMISFQNCIKKILILILSLIHCFNYPPLDNHKSVEYTLIILEVSSILFNIYCNDKKRNLSSKNDIYQANLNQNNINEKQPNKIEKISEFLINNFGFFNQLFFIINTIKDIMTDIGIVFFINIIIFLIVRKEK